MTEAVKWVVEDAKENGIFWPSDELKKKVWVRDESIYEEADKDPVGFWAMLAGLGLDWYKGWDKAYEEELPYFIDSEDPGTGSGGDKVEGYPRKKL